MSETSDTAAAAAAKQLPQRSTSTTASAASSRSASRSSYYERSGGEEGDTSGGSSNHQQHHDTSDHHDHHDSHQDHHHHHDHHVMSKEDLWKDALEFELLSSEEGTSGGGKLQVMGLETSPVHNVVYARIVVVVVAEDEDDKAATQEKETKSSSSSSAMMTVGAVVERVVDESWRMLAKDILEEHQTVQVDSYPSADTLLHLGAVWLLDETRYIQGHNAHAHRMMKEKDFAQVPNWNDMTLRIHLRPDRFHAAYEVDWSKYCRGLLIGGVVSVNGIDKPPVPRDGLPDDKDGVIVYEDAEHCFAILNKPGSVPVHPTLSNHAEDVVSLFSHALEERSNQALAKNETEKKSHHDGSHKHWHVSVPQRISTSLDIGTYGLLAVATQHAFDSYYSKLLEHSDKDGDDDGPQMKRHYKCLVCVPDADSIRRLEHFQTHQTIITHFVDPKTPAPKRFVRHKPAHNKNKKHHHWQECQLRIVKVGDDKFRAACVRSKYKESADASLAHRLWGPESSTPAEDLGFQYVMELEVEILNKTHRKHQIRGQLAALGCPIVGDDIYGGGKSEFYADKHSWNRMCFQCCELSFPEPMWKDEGNGDSKDSKEKTKNGEGGKAHKKKRELVPSERKCVFRLDQAWWSEFLQQYEMVHQSF